MTESTQRASLPGEEELREFVAHSNRIEREPDEPGHPLFDDHLAVARRVAETARQRVVLPRDIHLRLMASEPDKFPGEYRQVDVWVGRHRKVHPVAARQQMPDLLLRAMRASWVPASEQGLWNLHHEFEHIHPFIDGNGRTGRLWLNALRLACGYPWLTVRYEDRFDYYDAIVEWERQQ